MSDDPESLAKFRQLLETTTLRPDASSATSLTDTLVGAQDGALLRRCAVPHEFNSALLQRLGGLDAAQAEARYEQFAELSLIQINDDSLTVHERWRQLIWSWWLADARRADFVALSRLLADWFAAMPASTTGEDPAARQHMFHLIGCDAEAGLQLFVEQFRAARHRRRFSECALLLRLVQEYDTLWQPRQRALITYQQGKLASDLRQWEQALPLLRTVAADRNTEPHLRIHALVRAAHALRQTGRTHDALGTMETERDRARNDPVAARSMWRILHELGEIYRDLGRADDAAETLADALAGTAIDAPGADVPGVLNSLGTVQLKLRDTEAAVASFTRCLELLKLGGDGMRSGGVLNNLALAQLERCDWQAAETSLKASLDSKRLAGDLPGLATAWLNLHRTQLAQGRLDDARSSAESAAAAFETVTDARGRARARLAIGKLRRRAGELAQAAALLEAVAAEARAAGDEATAEAAAAELALSVPKRGMPAWGWALVVIAALAAIGAALS